MRAVWISTLALCAVLAVLGLQRSAEAHPDGTSVAINFGADEPPGVRSDVLDEAGVLGTVNWNNLDLLNGGPVELVTDDSGEAANSPVTVEWNSNNTWSSTGRGNEENNTAPDGDDRNLMTGYLDTNADDPATVTVSGLDAITDEAYSVYVYINGGVTGRGGDYTIGGDTQSHVDIVPFDGTYTEGPEGEYLLFRDVVGDVLTLTAQPTTGATRRAPINAIEIVAGDAGVRTIPVRAVTPDVDSEACPPDGRGPLTVTIDQGIAEGLDPAEMVNVVDTVTGSLSMADVSAEGASVEDTFPTGMTDQGFITAWLMLGPFSQDGGAAPGFDLIALDYLTDGDAIDEIDVEPREGDTVNTDYLGAAASTGLADSDADINPGGVPTWGAHIDFDDTINFDDYYGGDVNNIMMYAVTYVKVEDDVDVSLCVGSDDAVQVLIDGVEAHINDVARPVGASNECQDADIFFGILSEGIHRVMVKVFEGGGGHAFRLSFRDSFTGEPAEGISVCLAPDQDPCEYDPNGARISWNVSRQQLADGLQYTVGIIEGTVRFAGTVNDEPILGSSVATVGCDTRVTNLTCDGNQDGGIDVSWENHAFADPAVDITIAVNGDVVATVPGDSTTSTLPAERLTVGFNTICVTNSSGTPVCCTFLTEGISVADFVAGGDGTGSGEFAAVSTDAGTFLTREVVDTFHNDTADTDGINPSPAESKFIDSVFFLTDAIFPINSAGVEFEFRPEEPWPNSWNHILANKTHDIDKDPPIEEIFAGGMEWATGVGVHASAGITFDLSEIRAEHGNAAVHTFSTFAGNDNCGGGGDITLYIIYSDGQGIIEDDQAADGFVWNVSVTVVDGQQYEGRIPPEADYLSLVVGGLNGIGCAHGVFANPQIVPSSGPPEICDNGEDDDGDGDVDCDDADCADHQRCTETIFRRGDTDTNGRMELTDAIGIFNFLFITGIPPLCFDAADADDNNAIELTDGIRILNVLFLGFGVIPEPGFLNCGPDPSEDDFAACTYEGC